MDWRDVTDAALEATIVGSFSRIGCQVRRRVRAWEDLDDLSMAGRVVLVTGATSGLGRAAAEQLARMGAAVRVCGRSDERIEQVVDTILHEQPRADVAGYRSDLSDLREVERLVAEVAAREARLDVIVNNAGALYPRRQESAQGIELSLATMVLAPLVLTEGLVDLLARDGGGRVVNVASGGMYTQGIDLDDLQSQRGYRGSVAYARAKRALVVMSEMWAERWRDRGVTVHAMHPGWAATPGVHASLPTFERVMGSLLRTAEEGADTIVWLAASEEAGRTTGRFWHDRRPRGTHYVPGTTESAAERDELWNRLHVLAGTDAAGTDAAGTAGTDVAGTTI